MSAQASPLTFGNARHLAGEGEVEHWQSLGDHPLAAVCPDPHGTIIAPGVSIVATPGHTPGHRSLVVSSGPDRARIMGELEGDPDTVAAQCHLTGSAFGRVVRGRSRRTWTSLASQGAS